MNKKTVLIAGGTGLVGSRISEMLPGDEYNIHILTRNKKPDHQNIKYFEWDVDNQEIDLNALKVDHIINLTGAGIADKRWSNSRKKIIIESRVDSLKTIIHGLQKINHKPDSVVCASAIGYYGDRGNELLSESSDMGTGFLAKSCELWEKASEKLIHHSHRGTIFRIGIVLSSKGGALQKILMTRKLGVINYFGNGDQYYSFIHIDDLANIMIMALENSSYNGIINAVAPNPLKNKDFSNIIAESLSGYQAVLPAPAFALKMALGEMSSVVLDSSRVVPDRLKEIGYEFLFPELSGAIIDIETRKV